jgi:hypothetical protein
MDYFLYKGMENETVVVGLDNAIFPDLGHTFSPRNHTNLRGFFAFPLVPYLLQNRCSKNVYYPQK